PQDRLGVLRDRREALLHVDRDHRRRAALVELHASDLADVHAGDPDVGLVGQCRGLAERDLELVTLRLQRDGAAERDPEEQQDPQPRQREHHHREDPADAGSLLGHYLLPPPQNFASVNTLDRGPNSASAAPWVWSRTAWIELQSNMNSARRNGPSASE